MLNRRSVMTAIGVFGLTGFVPQVMAAQGEAPLSDPMEGRPGDQSGPDFLMMRAIDNIAAENGANLEDVVALCSMMIKYHPTWTRNQVITFARSAFRAQSTACLTL